MSTHTEYMVPAHPPHHSGMACNEKSTLQLFPSYGKNCSVLIPKLCKPQTNLRKKPSKYAHNPQKYANTDKSKQFAISVLFVLDMDIIQYKKVLVGLPSKAFNAQYAQHRGQTKGSYTLDLVIKIWSDVTRITYMSQCIHHCYLCDAMIWRF